MSNGVIASLFRKKSIREAAQKSVSLSQSKPRDFNEEKLLKKLQKENERLLSTSQKQEETIRKLTEKINILEGEIPQETSSQIEKIQEEIDSSNKEIDELRRKFKEISQQTQKNSINIAEIEGDELRFISQQRHERIHFMLNPDIIFNQKRQKYKNKCDKLRAIKEEFHRQTEIEEILRKVENDYKQLTTQIKILEEREEIQANLQKEEINLQEQLKELQDAAAVHSKISILHLIQQREDKVTQALHMISSFSKQVPTILLEEEQKLKNKQ